MPQAKVLLKSLHEKELKKVNGFQSGKWLLDQILPPTCCGCGVSLPQSQTLCAACWGGLTFLGAPCCEACGHPFEYAVPDQSLCGGCTHKSPPYTRARSALRYDDASKDFILAFKHADKTDTTPLFAKWMMMAGRDLIEAADVLIPVPLHWTRLFNRRYNQAALLAQALGKLSNRPVCADALIRHRRTPSQGHMTQKARARNVNGAFRVAPKRLEGLNGKRVVLIDDVYTTGATVHATTKVLLRSGVANVDVLTMARVVRTKTL